MSPPQCWLAADSTGVLNLPVAVVQLVVLEYRMDRTVATEDDPPVVLGSMPEAAVLQLGSKLRAGKLLRFSIREEGVSLLEGRPVGADLHYEVPARGWAGLERAAMWVPVRSGGWWPCMECAVVELQYLLSCCIVS